MTTLVIDRSRNHNWINDKGVYEHYRSNVIDWYNLSNRVDCHLLGVDLRSLLLCSGGYSIYLLGDNSRVDLRIENAFKVLRRLP